VHDNNAGGNAEGLENNTEAADAPFGEVLTAIPKVHFVTSFIKLRTNFCY
jgi:hypothetical protein